MIKHSDVQFYSHEKCHIKKKNALPHRADRSTRCSIYHIYTQQNT